MGGGEIIAGAKINIVWLVYEKNNIGLGELDICCGAWKIGFVDFQHFYTRKAPLDVKWIENYKRRERKKAITIWIHLPRTNFGGTMGEKEDEQKRSRGRNKKSIFKAFAPVCHMEKDK